MSSRLPLLSIVIPVLDEADELPRLLQHLARSPEVETLFVDGGSQDGTVEILREAGCRVLTTTRGRARQMNLGARHSQAEVLLFLHADSQLEEGAVEAILRTLDDPHCAGGAFRLVIRSQRRSLAWIQRGVWLRSRLLRMPYGDQGIFLRRKHFESLGGFREIPIMEDLDLVHRMKRAGGLRLLPLRIQTSDRRWRKNGVLRTTLLNVGLATLFVLRIPVEKLARVHARLSDPAHGKAVLDQDPGCPRRDADRGQGGSRTSPSQQVSNHERLF